MGELLGQIFWPPGFFGKLGRVVGGLSVLALVRQGFQTGFSAVFQTLLAYYESLAQALFGWAEPYIQPILNDVYARFGLHLILYPHWKHIFVLMGIYLFRSATSAFAIGIPQRGFFRLPVGFVVALASSVAAGTIPLAVRNPQENFFIGVIPILGILTYDIIDSAWIATFEREREARVFRRAMTTWGGSFKSNAAGDIGRALFGAALIWLGLQTPYFQGLTTPGLALLALFVVALALHWLWRGLRITQASEGRTRMRAFLRAGPTRLGMAMLGVFFWVALYLLLNAGLHTFGL